MKENTIINNIMNVLNSSLNKQIKYLYENMSTYQKEIFTSITSDPVKFADYSLSDIVFDFDTKFVEYILDLELDLYLKDNQENNKRNGYTKDITLKLEEKTMQFNRPRLGKESLFDSQIIPKRTRIMKDITNDIVLLFSKNNSVNDIKDILKGMFDLNISSEIDN